MNFDERNMANFARQAVLEGRSPCVGLCSTAFDTVCRGCLRTDVEVANWVFMTPEEQQAVWERILRAGYLPRT